MHLIKLLIERIHMNGRVYDPMLGRFLSADPHIQSPYSTQSYNRYSYVMNNPLKYSDPSGYFFKKLFSGIAKVFRSVGRAIKSALQNPVIRTIAGIAAAWYVGGWALEAFGSKIAAGAFGGFAGGFVSSGGDLKTSVIAGLTGAAAGYISGLDNLERFGKAMAHGAVGGVSSKLQGGKFASGFISSAFAKSISGKVAKWADGNHFKGAVAMAMVGGTASVLGGGKFGNGAMTSAIQFLFNEVSDELDDYDSFASDKDQQVSELMKKGTYFVGVGGEAVIVKGYTASFGFMINPNEALDSGLYISVGEAYIFEVGTSAEVGWCNCNTTSDVYGQTDILSITAGKLGVDIPANINAAPVMSQVGLLSPPVPGGISYQKPTTYPITPRVFIDGSKAIMNKFK